MTSRFSKGLACVAVVASSGVLAACTATGSNHLTCDSTEVAPSSQPGSSRPGAALEWYLKNGDSGLPQTGFRLTGSSATRSVYSDGTNQISVGALPTEKGTDRTWVVLMTYDCS